MQKVKEVYHACTLVAATATGKSPLYYVLRAVILTGFLGIACDLSKILPAATEAFRFRGEVFDGKAVCVLSVGGPGLRLPVAKDAR